MCGEWNEMKENVREAPARCHHQQCTRSVGFHPHCWWQRALTFQFSFVWPGRVSSFILLFSVRSSRSTQRKLRKVRSEVPCLRLRSGSQHAKGTSSKVILWVPVFEPWSQGQHWPENDFLSASREAVTISLWWRSGFFSFSFSLFPEHTQNK